MLHNLLVHNICYYVLRFRKRLMVLLLGMGTPVEQVINSAYWDVSEEQTLLSSGTYAKLKR